MDNLQQTSNETQKLTNNHSVLLKNITRFSIIVMPTFAQTNSSINFGLTVCVGCGNGERILDIIQFIIGFALVIAIITTFFSFIMFMIFTDRLKKFDIEHKIADKRDQTNLNINDAQWRLSTKKKIKLYITIAVSGVFLMILLLFLYTLVIFRAQV